MRDSAYTTVTLKSEGFCFGTEPFGFGGGFLGKRRGKILNEVPQDPAEKKNRTQNEARP